MPTSHTANDASSPPHSSGAVSPSYPQWTSASISPSASA